MLLRLSYTVYVLLVCVVNVDRIMSPIVCVCGCGHVLCVCIERYCRSASSQDVSRLLYQLKLSRDRLEPIGEGGRGLN